MDRQEITIDGVSYISLNDAVEMLGLPKKEAIELMKFQGVWPTAISTKIGLSPETCISRRTSLLVELKEAENLARIFSRN